MIKKMTVQDVLTYIEKNLEDDISIDDIVKISGYGRRYIQYIFKYYVKMPIGMYIRKRRIARSSILLRLTKMSVIEISVKLSFDYVTNEKCLQRLKVFNTMGRAGDNPACRDLHFRYPGGLYAHFQFDCTRDEYPAYSAFIYQHVLASYGFKRRDGYDIEIFSVLDLAKGILHCEYYIPVAL